MESDRDVDVVDCVVSWSDNGSVSDRVAEAVLCVVSWSDNGIESERDVLML